MAESTKEYEYSNRGRAFIILYKHAEQLFEDDAKHDECMALCRQLIGYADLGDYHRAGCHLMLACGSDNCIAHAEQAVDLWQNLFVVRPGHSYSGTIPPSQGELQVQEIMLKAAQDLLKQVQSEHDENVADYNRQLTAFVREHGRMPTDQEVASAHAKRDKATKP